MITRTSAEVKTELSALSHKQLLDVCMRLVRFKKENKELLSYLLFYAHDEEGFRESAKQQIDESFDDINVSSWYFIKKSLRKILRNISKYNRFSASAETEVELLLHFINKMKSNGYTESSHKGASGIYDIQFGKVSKLIEQLHTDLQFDYKKQLDELIIAKETGIIRSIFKGFRKQ